MPKPEINATEVIKFALAIAVAAVGAALYIPSAAQTAVHDHEARIEKPAEDRQDKRLDTLEADVKAVQKVQVALQTDLENTQKKLDDLAPKLDALLFELRKRTDP